MYKWQQAIIDKMSQYKGNGMMQITGRHIGKSTMSAAAVERLIDDLGPYRLKLDTIVIHDELYYEVKPVGWMHKDELQWNDMITWVVETFGPTAKDGVWTSGQRWYCNNARFYFKDIKDRDWFILRWS
jgi:hypothetical protein